MKRTVLVLVVAAAVALTGCRETSTSGSAIYFSTCSACHGVQLNGSDQGPPLVHPFYKPSHHNDGSIYRAALKGVKQHHWNFGNMPPVAGMTPGKMDSVVPYIRYYQQQKKLY